MNYNDLTESGAQSFANSQKELGNYEKEIQNDAYILEHMGEILAELQAGKTPTLTINGKKVKMTFTKLLQTISDLQNIGSKYTDLSSSKISSDETALNKVLKKVLSGYNNLQVPVGNGQFEQLMIEGKNGKLRPATAYDLLANWNGSGKAGQVFHIHISDYEVKDPRHQAWTHSSSYYSNTCTNSSSSGENQSSMSIDKDHDKCGDVVHADVSLTAQAIAKYLKYDHTGPEQSSGSYNGSQYFNHFMHDHGWG